LVVSKGGGGMAGRTLSVPLPGAGLAYKLSKLRMYALSALGTGSPSLMKLRKRLFAKRGPEGFVKGSSDTGGVPKVRQWMRLKRWESSVSSELAVEESMCA